MWLEAYLVQRGGRVIPADITAPFITFPDNPVDPVIPVHESLLVEKAILEDAYLLCNMASRHHDYAMEDAITTRFLRKETKHVKDFGDLLQQSVRVSKQVGHGVYHLDRELRESKGCLPWTLVNNPDHVECILKETAAKELKEVCKFCDKGKEKE